MLKLHFILKCPALFMAGYFFLYKILLSHSIGQVTFWFGFFDSFGSVWLQNYSEDENNILRHLLDHHLTNLKTNNNLFRFLLFFYQDLFYMITLLVSSSTVNTEFPFFHKLSTVVLRLLFEILCFDYSTNCSFCEVSFWNWVAGDYQYLILI